MFAGKFTQSASVLIAMAVLSGCAMGKKDNITVSSVSPDYTARHPIVLTDKEQVLDIPVSANAKLLSYEALSNVRGFSARYAKSGSGVIVMMLPSGSANEAAAHRVQHQVFETITHAGGHPDNIAIQSYDASKHSNVAPIRLSYHSVAAVTSQCGNWPADLSNTVGNNNYHDFGCSTQNNLAAQVANPSDFLGPRAETEIDAENRAVVITDYRGAGNP